MRRAMAGKKKWLAVVAIAVVAAAAIGGWALVRPGQSAATTTSITSTVAVGTIRQTVATTGTLAPAQRADLTFQVSGTVTAVTVTVGEHVAAGATLATVGNTDLLTSVNLASASVTAAEDQVTSAATGTAAQQASANAQLAAARSTLARAQASLAEATLTSPISGTVAAVSIAPGDVVTGSSGSTSSSGSGGSGTSGGGSAGGAGAGSSGSGSSSSSSTAQITVISTNAWVVNASVGASDLASVHPGLQVVITPDGTNQQVFGTVGSVGIMASSGTSGTAAFPVVIKVTGTPPGLYAGATVSAAIVVKQLSNVLTVPTAAVSSDANGTYVTLVKNGQNTKTKIVIGSVFGPSTQVVSGVSAGDQVLVRSLRLTGGTGGTTRLRNGTGTGGGGFGGGGFGGGGFGGGGGTGGAVGGN